MSWADKKKEFERRYNAVSSYWQNKTDTNKPSLTRDIDNLNTAVAGFIKTGGVSQDPTNDPNYTQALNLFNSIKAKKQEFDNLNKDIRTTITGITKEYDTGSMLKTNGDLQQDIIRLEKQKVESNNDASTANLRDKLIKERDTAVTRHQLFFLDRPVKSSSIPILWGLSILFVAAAIIVFKQLFPAVAAPGTEFSLVYFFMDPRIWIALTAAAAIVIIFLVLKIVGVFGPKHRPKPVKTE
jgi:hypothetical protein